LLVEHTLLVLAAVQVLLGVIHLLDLFKLVVVAGAGPATQPRVKVGLYP
jgi:hypothetical protein